VWFGFLMVADPSKLCSLLAFQDSALPLKWHVGKAKKFLRQGFML
jgi:hypothetical protein